MAFMRDRHGDILEEIREKKAIDDSLREKLVAALEAFQDIFQE
jgi:F0F1-type ATP synthase alpha subunit